jgi:AmiR/NasT family two-component response regulator
LSFLLSLSLPLGALLNGEAVRQRLERATQLLADRKVLARAKGVLQANLGWTEEEAYLHIRRLSRQSGVPMRDIARQVIEAGQETPSDAN